MDDLTSEQRHKVMSRIKSRDTKPEVMFRRALWHAGIRYRKNYKALPGKPDIAITKHRIAVFVDGEYFHGKDWDSGRRERAERGANAEYWVPKIERNMQRDSEADASLNGMGWTVLRFWSRDVLKNPQACVDAVLDCIFNRRISQD